jgi:dihydroxyacetone kinase
MKLQGIEIDTYELLDAPTEAHSWLGVQRYWENQSFQSTRENDQDYFAMEVLEIGKMGETTGVTASPPFSKAITSACQAVLKIEKELTEYDTVLGDGDCGHTFASGALGASHIMKTWAYSLAMTVAVLSELQRQHSPLLGHSPAAVTERIASILEDNMGGTVGARE